MYQARSTRLALLTLSPHPSLHKAAAEPHLQGAGARVVALKAPPSTYAALFVHAS